MIDIISTVFAPKRYRAYDTKTGMYLSHSGGFNSLEEDSPQLSDTEALILRLQKKNVMFTKIKKGE